MDWQAHPQGLYYEQRRAASEDVERKTRRALAMHLDAGGGLGLMARLAVDEQSYRVAQQWRVAVIAAQPIGIRKSSQPSQLVQPGDSQAQVYRFHVDAVSGENAIVSVSREGDSQIARITLDSKRRLLASAAVNGPGAGFDLFPMSIPSVPESLGDAASRVHEVEVLPALPAPLRALKDQLASFSPGMRALSFRGEDAFARAVEVVWRKGDPWPLYMRGPAGVAVLLREAP